MQLMENTHMTHKESNFRYGGHQNVNSFDPAPNFRLTLDLIQQKEAEKPIDRVSLFFSHKKPPTAKSAVGGNIILN